MPKGTPDGRSLEEQVNSFLATLPPFHVKDVAYHLEKTSKIGDNFVFAAVVVYLVDA